ncbi:Tetratricopeptide repeat protein [Planctomycetes bacterium Pla163]|uniref:Tetratricopeptide repeat protein n=1 Tax=Rohdeia mirabilis TaxID=2528008 RepID=A0A518CXE2_9BACT|nr:Tetratricopeptide repeat protein [Planctomycetes bacterium Pla163]
MKLRQEQIVFAVALLIVGGMYVSGSKGPEKSKRPDRGVDKELVRYDAPALLAEAAEEPLTQELFSPPRDSRPLPPLGFVEPPLPDLLALAPPPATGLAPSAFGRLLRTAVQRGTRFDLFDDFDVQGAVPGGLDEDSDFADVEIGDGIDPDQLESEERRQLETLYRQLYDVLELTDFGTTYGRMANEDPYGLRDQARANEPIQFVEVVASSGQDRYPGQPPVTFERARVRDFSLAQTPENEVRQAFHDLPEVASPATWRDMIELAERCVELKYEFDGALDMARELYERVAVFRPEEPEPILGLVRVHEAAFDFEAAFAEAERAVEKFGFRPEPLVALARLERTFLMDDSAEARLREAVRVERGTWVASAALGELLVDTGRYAEAIEHLARAFERLPTDVGVRRQRDRVRGLYATAMLGAGRVTDAAPMFAAMLNADGEDQRGMAGLIACELLGAEIDDSNLPEWAADPSAAAFGPRDLRFEVLVNRGLAAIAERNLEAGLRDLQLARRADPLHEVAALRGLAWLAENAGLVGRSLELTELALETRPGDVWCLLHRGRLLLESEDYEGAEASLRAALEQDAELGDALALLGWLGTLRSRFDEAELYYERAIQLAERAREVRPDLWLRRGINHIQSGAVLEARDALQTALELDPENAIAMGVRAWCEYLLGDAEEAVIRLRQMDDRLRSASDDDPRREWARQQIERITEHLTKVVWIDGFEYSTVGLNNWFANEVAGPTARLADGVLRLEGTFDSSGEVRYYQEISSARFVAFEADLWVSAVTNGRAGIFVARENARGRDERQTLGRVNVARSRDGVAQVLADQSGRPERGWTDLPESVVPFAPDTWHRLRIETDGEGSDATLNVFIDGLPVIENERFSGFGRANNLVLGVFVEGDTGRQADVRLDNVEITKRNQ